MQRWICVLAIAGCEAADDPAAGETGTSEATTLNGSEEEGSSGDPPIDDPIGVVAMHNDVRANAQPPPDPPLPDMVWDEGLATIATMWAEGCVFEHSMGDLGENLYAGTGTPGPGPAVQAWADEASMYDYDTNGCSGVCGHYTQIVWRESVNVGCGYADCPELVGTGFNGRMWVCNYAPPGNYVGERPY